MNKTILLVDDDHRLRDLLKDYLNEKNLKIFTCQDYTEAKEVLKFFIFDLIILDRMMPSGDGVDLISFIKNKSNIPIIILTAMGEDINKIHGLKKGSDDYVTKPFSQMELLARINSLLRRSNPSNLDDQLSYKSTITMDLKTHRVKREGKNVKLNPKEFELLRLFLENPGKVFSRDQLLDKIWGDINVELRTVDVHIRRLRKNININNTKDLIRTVRSSGYSLDIVK